MKKGAPSLAIVFGSAKRKPRMSDDREESDDYEDDGDMEEESGSSEAMDRFERYIVDAFPELEDQPTRIEAFWMAVRACKGA